jgi:hypothetical protein
MVAKKDPAAVALGRKGGKRGGPARAAKLTPSERSESARNAVRARWAKAKGIPLKRAGTNSKTTSNETSIHTSKKALHACLKRIKDAKSEDELRVLTEELQRIVFHRQYTNAEN